MRGGLALLLLSLGALAPRSLPAQVYHWVDEEGVVHYSALPSPDPTPAPADQPASRGEAARIATIPFTPGTPILVPVRLNGTGPVLLILDTGADRTIVSPAALARLGIGTASQARAEIQGVTGTSRADVVWLDSIEVGPGLVGPLPVIVHDANLREADGLLGRDVLSAFTVTIDAAAGQVTLGRD